MTNPQRRLRQYFDSVVTLATTSKVIENGYDVKINVDEGRPRAIIRTHNPLRFKDGATLRFNELIDYTGPSGELRRDKYSYHYASEDGKTYFRYDRDTAAAYKDGVPLYHHPENHLHVNSKQPRFMTHATSFEEVLRFIEACFYKGR